MRFRVVMRPFGGVAVGCLVQGLSDVVVCALDEAIGTGVVTTDANVMDLVLLREPFQSFDEGRTVVGHDFE